MTAMYVGYQCVCTRQTSIISCQAILQEAAPSAINSNVKIVHIAW
jgi:hypothetical protein